MPSVLRGLPARMGAVWRLPGAGYLGGILAFLLALWARFLLVPVLPPMGFPFLTFFPAVVLATLFCGLGPGLLVSALSTAAAKFFFIPTVGSFSVATTADLIALGFFVAVILVDCIVIHIMTVSLASVRESRAHTAQLAKTSQALAFQLAATEARQRATFEQAAVGIAEVALDGRWLRVNRQLCALLGYTRAELLDRTFQEITHPADLETDITRVQALLAGEISTYSLEKRYIRKDGTYLWANLTVALLRDEAGEALNFVSVIEDISTRKTAEAAVRESSERLQLALEAGRMGVWSWNLEAGTLEWDERQYALFGFDPAQGPVSAEAALERVHPEDRPALDAAIQSALDTGNGTFACEFRVRPPTGRDRWIGGYGHAVAGPTGKAERMVGLNFDVTDRREVQHALHELNATLEARVREEIEAREAAQTRAAHAERIQALGQLAGGIAHDFNNVLQAVQGGASLILRRPDQAESTQRFARMILDAADRGSSITRRLLAFARRDELRAEQIIPGQLLDGLQDILTHTLGAAIQITVEHPETCPSVLADKGQLETVLVNLATNARDVMPDGGTLTLRSRPVAVSGDLTHPANLTPGEYVQISVQDNGPGMDAALLDRVLEPFFTTKPQGKGTGLGLPMAKGFAEQSGGGFQIESAPGRGTTVSLFLAVAPAAAESEMATAGYSTNRHDNGGCRVMLVEDEPGVRDTLAAELEGFGYATLPMRDGTEALAALEAALPVDILVTDFNLPGMDGLEVMRAVRSRRPGLPSILLTGYAGDAVTLASNDALNAPIHLVRKPVTGEQLANRIAAVLKEMARA